MTEQEKQEIRERWEISDGLWTNAKADIFKLLNALDERDREVEFVKSLLKGQAESILRLQSEVERLNKENERIKADWEQDVMTGYEKYNELRKALEHYARCPECMGGTGVKHFGNDPKYYHECERCKIARQALNGEEKG